MLLMHDVVALLLLIICYLYLTLKRNTRHLYDKNCFIYRNQTILQYLLRNKLNIEYFTCDKLKTYLTSVSMVLHI